MSRTRLGGEQFGKKSQHTVGRDVVDRAQAFDQAGLVHRPDLIEDNLSGLSLKANRNAGGIETPLCRHGRDNHCIDVSIHFIGRDNQAGACLPDFSALGGIESNEVNLEAAGYQRHSSRSHREGDERSRSSSWSSPARCIARKASSQPLRGREAERTTSWFP